MEPAEVAERESLPDAVTDGSVPAKGLFGLVQRIPVPALPVQNDAWSP
jgi:hypothetical protein